MSDTKTNHQDQTVTDTQVAERAPDNDAQDNNAQDNDAGVNEVLVNGEVFDNWPQDLFIPPDALEIFLETFQGPLDLLLYLTRKQNLDILDMPIARITKQYMEYVEMMRKFRLDLAAEYLVMAAMLAEIKSRLLLPRPSVEADDEEQDPRAALVRRLQAYERFSQASKDIDERPRLERELYLVNVDLEDGEPVKIEARASLNDLAVAFRNVLERSEMNKHIYFGREKLTVREKMIHILERVRTTHFLRFEDLFDPLEGKPGLVVSFMAILELARDDMLIVVQNEPFMPVHLKSVEKNVHG